MQLFDPKNPNEKKKMIAAAVLGVGAIVVLGYVFFGGSSTKPATNLNAKTVPSTTPARIARDSASVDNPVDDPSVFQPIKFDGTVSPVSDANRNIFAYYEPPPPLKVVIPPTPTPTPVPPVTLASLAPSNVYARTADFTLEVTGEKFTPAVRINLDGRELPTRFINAQQVGTTVPASLISNPGARMVMLRSSDGKLYSNTATLTVTPPPLPNYNYIGLIGKPRFNDTAVLQKKGEKDLINVQRGEVLEGRFRVTSISEREVVLVDTTLKIRHTIPFTVDNSNPQYRPPVRATDDEP